jgi:tetratricopeptide (TPR) repeat protein
MTLEHCLELVELGQLPQARRLAVRGLASAYRVGNTAVAAKFHLLLAWVELDRGRPAASTKHLDAAEPLLSGNDLARAHCLRGLHLCQHASPRLAIAELTAAVRELRRYDDRRWLANALIGRGIARAYALRLAEADADFSTARRVLISLGEPDRAAMCLHNRGFVAMLAGDLPAALSHYEHAAQEGLAAVRRPEALIDRAEALLAAGLVREAREVLAPAMTLLDRCDRGSRLPDAVLLAARCALAEQDFGSARTLGDRAAALFRRQRRGRSSAVAVSLRARLAIGERPNVRRTVLACEREAKFEDAAELRLAAGLPVPMKRGTTRLRALAWLARARSAPDRRRAVVACRAGLALVARDTWPGSELASIALGHAIAARDARAVLRWSRADVPIPVRVPPSLLAELRLARVQQDDDRVVVLERQVRRLSITAGRPQVAASAPRPDAALLSFTVHDGQLLAVSVVGKQVRLHRIGELDRHVRALRLAIAAGHRQAAREAAAALDRLMPPTGDGPLVVTPAGALHDMPWSALPSLRGRPVSVAATLQGRTTHPILTSAWIAGPDLVHAEREVKTLQNRYGGTALLNRSSTVDAALRAMDGVDVAHLAAHGAVRADQPLFSSVAMADGPLHGHDLDRLEQLPRVVVLSACDSGLAPAFLTRGTTAVIASTRQVPDDRVPALMATVHAGLHRGIGPAAALAQAQSEHGDLGFNCYGSG